MGTVKALLDWHGSPLVVRVARLVGRVAAPVVVVGAPGQQLPPIPGVRAAVDAAAGRGPLEGIAAGLRALEGRCEVAFVCATDHPLLHPAFVLALADALRGSEAVVPWADGMPHPLTAAYRTSLLERAEQLLEAGEQRASALAEAADTQRLDASLLIHRESLRNANTRQSYDELLRLPEPAVHLDGRTFHASTVGRLLGAVPGGLPDGAALFLDGERVDRDRELPLAADDELTLAASG